jgi:hypothetical protein
VNKQPSVEFALWQLADDVANSAEQTARDAFTVSSDGKGLRPSEIQLEVSRALRKTARLRLKAALQSLEKPKGSAA